MPKRPEFLVIDDNSDSRFLLVKTLLRKFPTSLVAECQESAVAVRMAGKPGLAAIVAHRASDADGIALIRMLRESNATVPIVMVSGLDRSGAAIKAGASVFLSYDEWLRIGTVVANLLPGEEARESAAPA